MDDEPVGIDRSIAGRTVVRSWPEARRMVRGKLVLTYEDYLQMPDDRNRREILGGDLYVTPAPTPRHQRVLVNLAETLNRWVRNRALGKVFPSPIDVVLSQVDVVQPDLVYVSADRLQIVTTSSIQGAPDLVIEILSPSTAGVDRGRKMETYARFGVQEYWLIDSDARVAEQYVLEDQTFRPTNRAEGDQVLTSALPGLTVDLSSIWE
ncbi:MAG: Uma2 family endonuclease [Armatimonadota bacterium]|nr:Uma2 family endonuclease [Armatimonadota bacterium]